MSCHIERAPATISGTAAESIATNMTETQPVRSVSVPRNKPVWFNAQGHGQVCWFFLCLYQEMRHGGNHNSRAWHSSPKSLLETSHRPPSQVAVPHSSWLSQSSTSVLNLLLRTERFPLGPTKYYLGAKQS